jgi:oligopeptidase B
MNRRSVLQAGIALPALALAPACATSGPQDAAMTADTALVPPSPRQEPVRIEQLGRVRIDEYQWMKDDNWQQVLTDPTVVRADIRAALVEDNAYTQAMLADTEALQERLFQEMRGRIKEDDATVPSPDGPWEYYTRYEIGAQHPIHARRPRGQEGPEQILLNEEAESQGTAYYSVGAAEHSPDHRYYAYAVDDQGSEVYTIKIRDIATGQDLPDVIEPVAYGTFTWSPDSAFIFWAFRDDNGRPAKIFRRPVGAAASADVLVYDEPDQGFFLGVGTTSSKDFILISCGNQEQSEYHTIPAATPTAAPTVFAARAPELRYDITHWNGEWYIRTNHGGAVDFKVMKCPIGATSTDRWVDFVPAAQGRYVVGVGAVKDFLVRLERVNALPQFVVRAKDGAEHTIQLDEEAYDIDFAGGYEWDTTVTRYIYQSPSTPRQWFDYDMATRERTLRKTQEVPSGHDPSRYVVRRFFTTARDGAQVPVTTLSLRDTPTNGTAPLLVYGYGSYGISMDATFSIRNLSLVDRGWVWAIAHVRGGSEMGFGWFLDGRKFKKKNTFFDFIDVTEDLLAKGYGAPGKVVAYGGSAGGMLMGAITNMRPDLYAGIIAAVPFVDVLNTMSDTSLPLTPPEWPEWGNPLEDAEAYDYIASYCPYTNVAAKDYPAVLATGGLSDPRVTWWEPQKWTARLRRHTTSANPILLRINLEAGHGGASGRFDFLKEIALDYAFAMKAVGAEEAAGGF